MADIDLSKEGRERWRTAIMTMRNTSGEELQKAVTQYHSLFGKDDDEDDVILAALDLLDEIDKGMALVES